MTTFEDRISYIASTACGTFDTLREDHKDALKELASLISKRNSATTIQLYIEDYSKTVHGHVPTERSFHDCFTMIHTHIQPNLDVKDKENYIFPNVIASITDANEYFKVSLITEICSEKGARETVERCNAHGETTIVIRVENKYVNLNITHVLAFI